MIIRDSGRDARAENENPAFPFPDARIQRACDPCRPRGDQNRQAARPRLAAGNEN